MRTSRNRNAAACWAASLGLILACGAPALAEGEKEAFRQAVEDYKSEVRAIEALWSEYQTAEPDRQVEINQQVSALVPGAKGKVQTMVDAALKAFEADPGGDQQVTDLLVSVARHKVVGNADGGGGDQYESAMPILQALIDGGVEQPELQVWAVLAAAVTHQFDLADKYAQMALSTGAIQTPPGDSEAEQSAYGLAIRYLQSLGPMRAKWEAEAKIRAAEEAADDLPRVKMTTNKGDIVFELYENEAPIAVANFLSLVKQGFYDGVVFHRVIARFMAQGGDPNGDGTGGPGYSIPCECLEPDARLHFRGVLSMAHAGRDTGGSQFFLTFIPTDHLDREHTVFGRVIEGFDVLGELQVTESSPQGVPLDRILSAEVLRDRGHDYSYRKIPKR